MRSGPMNLPGGWQGIVCQNRHKNCEKLCDNLVKAFMLSIN